jgi:diguanylate cyclase (GGDEF)-like protein
VNSVLSIPTLMICTCVTTLIVALAMTYLYINDNREKAIVWWCASMWAATIATAFHATRPVWPFYAAGLGNLFAILAYSLLTTGFVVFNRRRPVKALILAGPILWGLFYFGARNLSADINVRIVVVSVLFGTFALIVTRNAWLGWKAEQLPSFKPTMAIYGLHGTMFLARAIATLFYPAREIGGEIIAPWLGFFAIEGYALSIFSTFVFLALVKERAERKYRLAAEIDSLTGIASRRFFVAETQLLTKKRNASGALAVIDLDYFKKINDTYGHMAGDKVLNAFARRVAGKIETGMIFGRLGGEEFGLYLPSAGKEETMAFLHDLRVEIESLAIDFLGQKIGLTCSIGVAHMDEVGSEFDHLLAAADIALYVAKEEGRNTLKMFAPAMRLRKVVEGEEASRLSLSPNRLSRIQVRSRIGTG